MIRGGLPTLFVRDVGAAVRFYVETLGMKLVEEGGPNRAIVDAGDGLRAEEPAGAARGPAAPSIGLAPKIPIREAIARATRPFGPAPSS